MSDERTNVFDDDDLDDDLVDQEIDMEMTMALAHDPDEMEVDDEPVPVPKPEPAPKTSKTSNTSKTSTMSTKTFISIDNKVKDVLRLQADGKDLYFEDGDRFLRLDDEVYEELSSLHQLRYKTAEQITEGSLDFSRKRIVPRPEHGYATARNRLDVGGGQPGKHYTWQYADQLAWWESQGARPVVDPKVKTFTNPTGRSRTITESDGRQLVLLEMPEEVHEARRAVVREKARKQRDGFDEGARAGLERSGASVVDKREIERGGGTPRTTLQGE